DAFCMNWNGNGVAALSLDALGTQWEVDTLFSGLYLDQAEVLDLDGDGDMDIAKRNGIGVQWMRNNGNGAFPDFSLEHLQGGQWSYDHAFGNFGCGGGTEVFWSTGTPEQFKWSSWSDALDDLTPAAVLDQLPSSQMSVLQVGDLNGDGLDDIIVQQADSLCWMPSLPTVQPLPVIAPELDTLCGSSGTYVLPAGGEWWFDGYVTQAIPAGQVLGTTDTLVFLVEDSAGCVSADHATLTHVLEASMVGPFQGDPLCTYDEPVQLQGFPSGGAWSPPVDGSGLFDPGTTGPGSHPITFTYVDPTGNACQASEPLEVWASAFAALTPAGPFCEDDTLQLITATFGIYGGLFLDTLVTLVDSIPPIMTAAFDPGIGAGSYPIIVSGIGPMSCPGYDTLVVTVLPLPEVLVGPADTTLCLNTTLQRLPVGDPPGGSWTGPFIQPDGTLVTTDLGLGAHTAYYTYTDGNGCTGLDSVLVLVDICNGIGTDGRNVPGAWWDPMTGSVVLDADQWPYGDWQLFDGRGSLMAEGAIQGQGIPLGHWLARSGVYHVRLIDRGRARTIRFVY
ncbi:MAG: hypothetical protein KDB96_15120, partial [Flavobacteriales bacterium]|nr:hypothetical protein [Flavobacteriales bacterium]